MSEPEPRPRALVAIVIYKCFTVGLLTCVAIGLFLTSKKHDSLFALAVEYMMTGKREIIKAGLTQVLSVSTTKMQLGALVALVYAAVNGIEAFGLWNQKAWATILVTVFASKYAKKVVAGNLLDLEISLYQDILSTIDFSIFENKPLILKGCSKKPVPEQAYILAIQKLLPFAKSIMYGEACSAVPLYKK